jgi:predicted nucleic acid-binding protein
MPNEVDQSVSGSDVVLDTCCLVNLAAVDGTLACLDEFDLIWYLPTAVHAEGIFIRSAGDSRTVRRIAIETMVSSGIVRICAPADEVETALYVEFAASLDDGEAMALAIAKNRGWRLATDDRKALTRARAAGVAVVTTPELMRSWALRKACPQPQLVEALTRIETLAKFVPTDESPAALWWRKVLGRDKG